MTKSTEKILNIGQNNEEHKIDRTFSYGLIYVYSIPQESHRGRLKIGSATINSVNPAEAELERHHLKKYSHLFS